jgi:hypothetical protein
MKTRVLNLGFTLLICMGISACNKEEFYEKEFLDTPTSGSTNGSVDGGEVGGTQGGVDSGVNGGTTGGSTTGSSAGGTDGSTVGGSTGGTSAGGTDGSTVGGSTGGTSAGGTDGSTVGGSTGGTSSGGTDGSTVGGSTGGYGDCNNGHGNDADGVDESNPTVGLETKCKKEVFYQASEETKKLDVVWIVDNSGSMSDEQTALGLNFSAFIDDFILKNVDFKMAITTTDTSSDAKKGKMVTGSDIKLTSAMAQSNPNQFKADFKNLIKVGTSGSGNEKGLAASEGFMEKYSNSFVRPNAYLAVVVVSDEEDQSPKAVAEYTDYLKTFKASAGLVKVYSVVDVNNTNVGSGGITTGSERYKEASNRTAGLIADIRDDFYNVLTEMGESIINLLDSFALANEPVDGSLRVFVNNVETTNYTYETSTLSIKFNPGSIPPVGAEILVTYVKK